MVFLFHSRCFISATVLLQWWKFHGWIRLNIWVITQIFMKSINLIIFFLYSNFLEISRLEPIERILNFMHSNWPKIYLFFFSIKLTKINWNISRYWQCRNVLILNYAFLGFFLLSISDSNFTIFNHCKLMLEEKIE